MGKMKKMKKTISGLGEGETKTKTTHRLLYSSIAKHRYHLHHLVVARRPLRLQSHQSHQNLLVHRLGPGHSLDQPSAWHFEIHPKIRSWMIRPLLLQAVRPLAHPLTMRRSLSSPMSCEYFYSLDFSLQVVEIKLCSRGMKAQFHNPMYSLPPSAHERSLLPVEHPDYEASEACAPKLLFPSAHRRSPRRRLPDPIASSDDSEQIPAGGGLGLRAAAVVQERGDPVKRARRGVPASRR